MEKKGTTKISVQNRKASFEYELLEEFDAGIMLFGSEIKSIRAGNASISESYCYINNGEVFIKGMHIQNLKDAAVPHDPIRDRKLLLTKKEINKIIIELKNNGLSALEFALNKFGDGEIPEIQTVKFERSDIVRNPLITKILDKWDK